MGNLPTNRGLKMSKQFDVICVGAALVDMVARVKRHPDEDDEVFVSNLDLLSGGAAANTAAACAHLGLKSAFLGKIGQNDTFGKKILEDFSSSGVDISLIIYSNDSGTGSAYVALKENGDRRIYAHSGAANLLQKEDIQKLDIEKTNVVFLSSLRNMEPFIQAAVLARELNIPVILNPGMLIIDQGVKAMMPLLEKIFILILSKREFDTLFDGDQESGLDLLSKTGIKIVIITLGSEGALAWNGTEKRKIPPSFIDTERVVDTTGAGDSFSAGFIYGFCKHLNNDMDAIINDVRMGNFVAGNCIQELGARQGIPTKMELESQFP